MVPQFYPFLCVMNTRSERIVVIVQSDESGYTWHLGDFLIGT